MRRLHCVSKRGWDIIVSQLDGDLQEILATSLDAYTPGPSVTYSVDSTGQLDSESSPSYSA